MRRKIKWLGEEGRTPNLMPGEIGAYVAEIIAGIREVTLNDASAPIKFLDHLLEMAEHEARDIACREARRDR